MGAERQDEAGANSWAAAALVMLAALYLVLFRPGYSVTGGGDFALYLAHAQANLWFFMGAGGIQGNDFEGTKAAAAPGVQLDYETTRIYLAATGRLYRASDINHDFGAPLQTIIPLPRKCLVVCEVLHIRWWQLIDHRLSQKQSGEEPLAQLGNILPADLASPFLAPQSPF